VVADGMVLGRIMKVVASPVGTPWLSTLAYAYHEDRTPTHGYEPTRRGRDGGVREELAARIGRVLINAQIAAPSAVQKMTFYEQLTVEPGGGCGILRQSERNH
jgi:hypothetical protein